MDPDHISPLNIRSLLSSYGLRPSKGLGQNFLVDDIILRRIVKESGITNKDFVLEIGPGLGSLTRYIALAAHQVIAVELDQKLFPALQDILSSFSNIQLIQGDILQLDPWDLISGTDYLVVANIPYYITSALLRHLLSRSPKPRRIVLTIQKEMAERICASTKLSLLALSVQVFGKPSILMEINAKSFYPVPKVESALISIDIHPFESIPPEKLDIFFLLAKSGFSQKRKNLRNSLASGLKVSHGEIESILHASEIDMNRRAESLSLMEWGKLTGSYLEWRSR